MSKTETPIFRMYGDTVELGRYLIEHESPILGTERYIAASAEEKEDYIEKLGGRAYTAEAIDQTGNEWINGLRFSSYEMALEALEMGETAYRQKLYDEDTALQTAQYLTELDYRLLLVEWGLTA